MVGRREQPRRSNNVYKGLGKRARMGVQEAGFVPYSWDVEYSKDARGKGVRRRKPDPADLRWVGEI